MGIDSHEILADSSLGVIGGCNLSLGHYYLWPYWIEAVILWLERVLEGT
jgi:hypothetical protein